MRLSVIVGGRVMATTRIDLTGQTFGLLTVVGESHSTNSVYWRVLCACGVAIVRRGGDLLARQRRGQNQSCGCARARLSQDGMVRCGKCKQFKDPGCFCADGDKLHGHCKSCQMQWRDENRQLLQRISSEWRKKNHAKSLAASSNYRKSNPHRYAANEARRRAAKLQATPDWADTAKIQSIYSEASRLGLEVDHIVPLRGRIVCGLHVEHNMQLLTKAENSSKNNRIWPDMP